MRQFDVNPAYENEQERGAIRADLANGSELAWCFPSSYTISEIIELSPHLAHHGHVLRTLPRLVRLLRYKYHCNVANQFHI